MIPLSCSLFSFAYSISFGCAVHGLARYHRRSEGVFCFHVVTRPLHATSAVLGSSMLRSLLGGLHDQASLLFVEYLLQESIQSMSIV